MAENLREYLEAHRPRGFTSEPQYFGDGDFVTYFVKNDLHYAQRIDSLLTVYLSEETDELVGCKIKGVRRIVGEIGDFGVLVRDQVNRITLGLLVLTAATLAELSKRVRYAEVARHLGRAEMTTATLPVVAA